MSEKKSSNENNENNENNESIVFDEKKFNSLMILKNIITPLSFITYFLLMMINTIGSMTNYDGFIEYFIETYARYFGLIFIISGVFFVQKYSTYLHTNKNGGFLISAIISMVFGFMTFFALPAIVKGMPINAHYDNVYKEVTMKVDTIDSFNSGVLLFSSPMQKVFSGDFSFNAPFDKFSKGDEFTIKYSRSKDEFMEKITICKVESKYCVVHKKNRVEK